MVITGKSQTEVLLYGSYHFSEKAKLTSEVMTQTNSDKQNGMLEDLTLFQARKQLFLKQFLKPKFGVHFPAVCLRTRRDPIICIPFLGLENRLHSFWLFHRVVISRKPINEK